MKKMRNLSLNNNGVDLEQGIGPNPRRAHKSWQYGRPIRRYDHYCKWLNNVIGPCPSLQELGFSD
ncbi:cdc48 [Symbiodinium natans]|uniref:Cdc48 protein n=1 Tax=Symbiodinium natans TaxID=878477 RepID=A0A812M6X7_9DINO|nr:cdc48 [Symbiodinium natans]